MIRLCEYISTAVLSANTNNARIDTGVIPTSATAFRIKGIHKRLEQNNLIAGFSDNDSKDYRLFWYGSSGTSMTFDFNSARISKKMTSFVDGYEVDLLCGNNFIKSGSTQEVLCSGNIQSSVQDPHSILIDVGSWWFKSIEIWEGETKVFDGAAAYDTNNGNIGIYDSISDLLKYNGNLTMSKGADFHTFEASPTSLSFNSAGGSLTTTVNAQTGWTCTVPTGFTLSTTAGTSGTTSITVTAPSYTGTTDKSETVVFTDDDGYTINLALKQKKPYSAYTFCSMVKDQGHSWVDTGIYPDSATTIEIYVRNDYEEGGSVTKQLLIGNEEMLLWKNGTNSIYFNYGDGSINFWLSPQSSATFTLSNTGITKTDETGTTGRSITMTSFAGTGSTIKISGSQGELVPAFASYGRIVIKKGGNVVGDFMPCMLGTEVGFYDNVNQLFKNNIGSSEFTAIDEYGMVMGQEPFESLYLGTDEVRIMFLGEKPIYAPYSAPFSGLQMTSASSIGWSGDTTSLSIKSSEDWTLAFPAGNTWLSASTMSGTSGTSTVTLTAIENPTSSRTATITATTANYSATCVVTQDNFVENFMFNYNAKEYDASTHSFPKKSGQLFNEDLVLNSDAISASTDYVNINGQWMGKQYSSTADNPFNRGNDGKELTFIYKADFGNSGTMNLFANRGGEHNWMVRKSYFHSSSEIMQFTPSEEPCTIVITVDSNGNGERKCIETNQSATATNVTYGSQSNAIGFFSGYGNRLSEMFAGDFYWMFCANRKLTDDEISTVIYYNEHLNEEPPTPTGSTGTLSISVGDSIEELYDEGWEGGYGTHYTITLSGQSSDVAGFAYMAMDQMSYDIAIESEEDPDSLEYFIANANYTSEDTVTEVLGAEGTPEDGLTVDCVFIKAYAIDSNNDIIESISAITEDIHLTREGEGGEEEPEEEEFE